MEGGSEIDGAWWWGAGARLLEDELYSSVQARLQSLGHTEAGGSQEDLNWHAGGASWSNYCVSAVGVSTPVNPSAGLNSQFDGGDDGAVGEDTGLRGIYPGPGPVPILEAVGSRGSEKWPEDRHQVVPPTYLCLLYFLVLLLFFWPHGMRDRTRDPCCPAVEVQSLIPGQPGNPHLRPL